MKAAVYYENGGPEVFRYEEVPDPVCGSNDVLIKVEAASVEGGDLINREIRPLARIPHIVGYQCAGTIVAVGSDVVDRAVGDRVAAMLPWGSHAELALAKPYETWIVPPDLSLVIASIVPVAWGTAAECLFELGMLSSGDTVLIHAVAGALGIAALQLAKHAGATVIGTSTSPAKIEQLRKFGLDVALDPRDENLVKTVRSLTDGKGVDLVVDSVRGSSLRTSIEAVGYRGRVISVGVAGRDEERPDPVSLWRGSKILQGLYYPEALAQEPARVHAVVEGIFRDIARGDLEVLIDREYPLSEAADAHRRGLSREALGRVILRP